MWWCSVIIDVIAHGRNAGDTDIPYCEVAGVDIETLHNLSRAWNKMSTQERVFVRTFTRHKYCSIIF